MLDMTQVVARETQLEVAKNNTVGCELFDKLFLVLSRLKLYGTRQFRSYRTYNNSVSK